LNVLITGLTGLLGQHLGEICVKNKLHVYAIVRDKRSLTNKFKNIELIEADLSNMQTKKLPSDIDTIYYLAQSRRFRDFPGGAFDMLNVNVISPVKLIDWAVENNIKRFIYASSGGVYSPSGSPINENVNIDMISNRDFYLNTKISSEVLLSNYSSFFDLFAIVRPFFLYGEGQQSSMLIPRLINNVQEGSEILISGENGIKINPLYVDDAVSALTKLLDIKGSYTFNIGGNEIVSIKDLCDLISSIVGKKPRYKYINSDAQDLIGDISLMKTHLHTPATSLKAGLQKMVNSAIPR
jgi:UDP-glucose 4-epimerase